MRAVPGDPAIHAPTPTDRPLQGLLQRFEENLASSSRGTGATPEPGEGPGCRPSVLATPHPPTECRAQPCGWFFEPPVSGLEGRAATAEPVCGLLVFDPVQQRSQTPGGPEIALARRGLGDAEPLGDRVEGVPA